MTRTAAGLSSASPQGVTSEVPVVEFHNLSVRLGRRRILNRLQGRLKGCVVGLLGPNGAGKTTLLRTLLGLCDAEEGDASVLGHSLQREIRTVRSLVGYMPEDDAHTSNMTAIRWVRFLGELSGLPQHAALERAHEALTYVGLGEARYRKVGGFSTGMKQLVKLAQALVHGPRLLLLDEPTNGLDPTARARFLDLVGEIAARGETQILISSHLLGDVEKICDEVVILKGGVCVDTCDLRPGAGPERNLVELELTAPNNEFTALIRHRGCLVSERTLVRLQVELTQSFAIADVFAAAYGLGIGLRRVQRRTDTLQEIFLRAMEDDHGRD